MAGARKQSTRGDSNRDFGATQFGGADRDQRKSNMKFALGIGEHTIPSVIHLIGPGGAGKSTVVPHLAALLGFPSLDLDRAFEAAHGDIDQFINAHGYAAYASANVATYLAQRSVAPSVVALSSGFMVYPENVHPGVRELQASIAAASTTVLLLPSLDLEICVAETVRRQAARNLAIPRSSAREEAVIRKRFAQYRSLTDRVVTTMQPPESVARDVLARVRAAT